MTAYVELQDREFASEARGYTATRHQREVARAFFDLIATAAQPGVGDDGPWLGQPRRAVSVSSPGEPKPTSSVPSTGRLQRSSPGCRSRSCSNWTTTSPPVEPACWQLVGCNRLQLLRDVNSLDFLPETQHLRADPNWRVASAAPGLENRRVEITGPLTARWRSTH
jgi:hypothetical protein